MRRAQTAVEFLATYGWAMFAVIGTVALVSFAWGLGTPKLAVERCWASPGYDMRDCKVSEAGVQLSLMNILGEELENLVIIVNSTRGSDFPCHVSDASIASLKNGKTTPVMTLCAAEASDSSAGQVFDAELKVTYYRPGDSRQYYSAGKIQRRIE